MSSWYICKGLFSYSGPSLDMPRDIERGEGAIGAAQEAATKGARDRPRRVDSGWGGAHGTGIERGEGAVGRAEAVKPFPSRFPQPELPALLAGIRYFRPL